jgi:uncharacterized protein with HEPN domain
MERDPRAYLWDVQEAADAISRFVAGIDVQIYSDTPLLHSAVERKFEVIGEALNQLAKIAPDLAGQVPNLPLIVAFRNLLIHGYAAVDHRRVWRIILNTSPQRHEVHEGGMKSSAWGASMVHPAGDPGPEDNVSILLRVLRIFVVQLRFSGS